MFHRTTMNFLWRGLGMALLLLCAPVIGQQQADSDLPFPLIDRFETFGVEQGLPSWKVNTILAQGERVWAGTDRGLAVLERGKWRRVPIGSGRARQVVGREAQSSRGISWQSSSLTCLCCGIKIHVTINLGTPMLK